MSYSAFVVCNCYKEGKTTEPPYKEQLRIDQEGIYITIPDELWEKDKEMIYRIDREFDKWKRTACSHEYMRAANEYLSNISGMGAFRNIVNKLGGKEIFPVLTEYLPASNGGILPSEFADNALQELKRLENDSYIEELVLLKEKSTGEIKASVSADEQDLFVFSAGNIYNYGIDKNGFFILENILENDKIISYYRFRSFNFIQRTISKGRYKFINLPTGESYECSVRLHPNEGKDVSDSEFLIVFEKNTIAHEYEYMIAPLKKLAIASLQTGNPIVWM